LDPKLNSTIYDPACGIGKTLLTAYKYAIGNHAENHISLFGQEDNPRLAALARTNMVFHGVTYSKIITGFTLINPGFVQGNSLMQFDNIVVSELPVDAFAFIQHVVASLNEHGRAVLLISPRLLFVSGREGQIREDLLAKDLVEAVISLPSGLLLSTDIPVAVLILHRAKPENMRGKTLFIYANEKYGIRDQKRFIEDFQQKEIVECVREKKELLRFTKIASLEQIQQNNFSLIPARYVQLVSLDNFLGGTATQIALGDIAELLQGTISGGLVGDTGIPVIRGRDLSATFIDVNELGKVEPGDKNRAPLFTEKGDILIQRLALIPKAILVGPRLEKMLVGDTVFRVRLREGYKYLGRYLVDFINSEIGQGVLSSISAGIVKPTLRLSDLRQLKVPIPDRPTVSLVDGLQQVEQELLDRIDKARDIRGRLFSLQDPEMVDTQLSALGTEAKALSSSLIQSDDLDFQIRNFYPFMVAYAYRLLTSILEPSRKYPEQLRVFENILAFLGSVGLSLAVFFDVSHSPLNDYLFGNLLYKNWQGGITPGKWRDLCAITAGLLRYDDNGNAVCDQYASLWFRGKSKKETDFAVLVRDLIGLKNDFKHDRGPKTPDDYQQAVNSIEISLRDCLKAISFFVQYPIFLVENIDLDWETRDINMDTLVFVGDHPGLRQEKIELNRPLSKGILYLDLNGLEFPDLYPLISVHYCPTCKMRETYFVDRWDSLNEPVLLKSFERGHTLGKDNPATRKVANDLKKWIMEGFPTLNKKG
jgi:type I restriction enzyme M protein